MYQKFINFLYYKNQFKLIVYTLKIISLFDKKYEKQISFYNFFKKRKIKYKKNELIIFNSYLEHGVENNNLKEDDRISLPFDLIFKD